MAFNPFHTFSVRSRTGKSVLAVLTIVVMFMFVLSSGAIGSGNDLFDQLGGIFSSKRAKGDVIAKAYGDDVRSSELDEVRRQRLAAREYLSRAMDAAYTESARSLDADVKAGRLTGTTKDAVGRFVSLRLKADTERRAYEGYLMQFLNTQQFGPDLFKIADAFRSAKPESDDRKALDSMLAIIANDLSRQSPIFLVPLGTDNDRDVLDFLLLLKAADRMGIKFSTEGVKAMVARDTGGRLTDKAAATIEQSLRTGGRQGTVSPEWLEEALANEYRAKLALSAFEGKSLAAEIFREGRMQPFRMLTFFGVDLNSLGAPGELGTASAVAGGVTPHEFYEFYKDNCSEHSFNVLEVRAEAFLDQIKEQPTKADLNALFAKYRSELPDPSRDRPGFKEPRKVKLEFVALDATAPRIAQAVQKVEAAGTFLSATTGALSGNAMSALIIAARPEAAVVAAHPEAAVSLPFAPTDLAARQKARAQREANLSKYEDYERFFFTPRDTSIFRPEPIVSALGVLAGHPNISTFTAAAAAVHQHVERIDHQTRIPFLLQAVLTPFNPTLGNALGMPALALAHSPPLPPERLYLSEAIATARKDQLRNLFLTDVRRLESKLRKLTDGTDDNNPFAPPPKRDKATIEKGREEAKKFLADWLKDRGLTPAGNKNPVDQFVMATDPDLKPLNVLDGNVKEPDGTNTLTRRFFADPRAQFAEPEARLFQPFWFPGDPAGASLDKPNHLVWLTNETEAKTYNNLENADKLTNGDMTRRVERAWRLDKARVLAKAEADKLAEQVRAIGKGAATNRDGVDRQLKDLAAEKKLRQFPLDRLARLRFEHGLNPSQQEYKPPTIAKTDVLYPTPDFADRLLDLRKESVGAVTVLPDAPRTNYYVACLVASYERTVDQFREVFDKSNTTGIGRNPLFSQHALPEVQFRSRFALPEPIERMNPPGDARVRLRADAGLELKDAFTKRERKEEE
jgi:hypothetical protein